MPTLRRALKAATLFTTGGGVYILVELLWRHRTHWSMFLVGGLCFLLIGHLNEHYSWGTALVSQMVLSALIVTGVELAAGLVFNVWLGLGVWDYSDMPYNLAGQVCLLYSVLWCGLSLPAILLDDWLRWRVFSEERPRYKIL